MMHPKKIKEISSKKIAPQRLIKCYVCNTLFNTQNQYSEHMQQHQSKLNRTNMQQIQRKTQESFRTKKQPSKILRMTSNNTPFQTKNKKQIQQDIVQVQRFNENQRDQEEELSIALKQSQILLQRIEFLTQIEQEEQQVFLAQQKEEEKSEENADRIETQRDLYHLLCSKDVKNPQKLILLTNFQNKYFNNYQTQLQHLLKLDELSINPASGDKIRQIIKKIVQDVFEQLQKIYKQQTNKKKKDQRKQSALDFWIEESSKEVHYCSECYSQIEIGQAFYINQEKIAYHVECFRQIFQ